MPQDPDTPSAPAEVNERLDLAISGMSCAACASAVERRLAREPGVSGASVSLTSGAATVRFNAARTGPAALVSAIEGLGYGARVVPAGAAAPASRLPRREAVRLGVALALALPVFVIAMAHGGIILGSARTTLWVQAILSTPVVFWCGWPFIRAAAVGVRHGRASMDTLVALGAIAAWLMSTVALVAPAGHGAHDLPVHYESAAVVIALVLLGKRIEAKATRRAEGAIGRLIRLAPETARVLSDGGECERATRDLGLADVMVIRPGERIAADSRVVLGSSALDESMLSGESVPVEKGLGDLLRAGTLNTNGLLHAEVLRTPEDSTLARLVSLMREAQVSRVPLARLADRLSAVLVPIVLGLAVLTGVAWLTFAPEGDRVRLASTAALSVLVVSCPCALGLATPIVVMLASGRLAERGIVLRRGAALEHAAGLTTLLLDKTGTLTQGRLRVVKAAPAPGVHARDLARLAQALEMGSEHPIARAVVAWAEALQVDALDGSGAAASRGPLAVRASPGGGVEAEGPEGVHRAGSLAFLASRGVEPTEEQTRQAQGWASAGRTVIGVSCGARLAGLLALADEARPEARAAVANLRALGLRVRVLSGDSLEAVQAAAAEAGIGAQEVEAPCAPEDKLARLVALQRAGERVGMAGDGINDAPALARADVGVAMGAGAELAIEAADLTILRDDLRALPEAIELSRCAMRAIRRNLAWAFGYNIVAIPLAAGVLYPAWGILLSPMIAGAAMALSSLSVVLSSLAAGAAMKRATPARA